MPDRRLGIAAAAAAVAAALLGACSGSAAPPRFITVGTDAIGTVLGVTARDGQPALVLQATGDATILQVDESKLPDVALAMHEEHARCGGFMAHDSLAEAQAALVPAPPLAVDYTLDRPGVVAALVPRVDTAQILKTIGELSAMKNRYYRSESGAAASAWLAERWRGYAVGTNATVELFDQGYPQKSVILTIPGVGRTDEVVVIGGHLDSIAMGGLSANAPGADDDASGVATMSEVARVLLTGRTRPARTIKFIAYAAEEIGLRGSLAIVKEFKKRGVNVIGALQLDMTNYQGSDRDVWIIDDHTSHAQNAFLIQLMERYLDVTWGVDKCGYACSDHASWHAAGIPASMPFESRSKDMNKHIHSGRDTLEQSQQNADHAAKFARLAIAYAVELAKIEEAHGQYRYCVVSYHPRPAPEPDRTPLPTAMLLALGLAGVAWWLASRAIPR